MSDHILKMHSLIIAFSSSFSSSRLIRDCAQGREGLYLLAMAGEKTASLGEDFDFVPWVVLDGERVRQQHL
jgi:hypothetical protein